MEQQVDIMKERFKERVYANEQLDMALNKTLGDSRKEKVPSKLSLVCVLGYSKRAQQIKHSVKKYWHIPTSDPQIGELHKELPKCYFL